MDTVFGYPGGAVLNLYDALYKYQDRITHVLTAHEQGASHAADGYARATGRAGVCIATSGPGATNLVTAWPQHTWIPSLVVAVTGNVSVPPSGPRLLPGGGYHRYHHAGNQAQFYYQGRARPGPDSAGGLPHRVKRPSARCLSTCPRM